MYSIYDIPLNFDPLASVAAVCAIYLAISESRKNNNVIVKIINCTASSRHEGETTNGSQLFWSFKIIIQNKGVPLHDISLQLSFDGSNHSGRCFCPIPMHDSLISNGIFEKGMIAEFELKSYSLKKDDPILNLLHDIKLQRTTLNLYSQGYIAKVFNAGSLFDKVRQRWNYYTYKLKFEKAIGINREGHQIKKIYKLPSLCTIGDKLSYFIHGIYEMHNTTMNDKSKT